jgi:hypothetical protein
MLRQLVIVIPDPPVQRRVPVPAPATQGAAMSATWGVLVMELAYLIALATNKRKADCNGTVMRQLRTCAALDRSCIGKSE